MRLSRRLAARQPCAASGTGRGARARPLRLRSSRPPPTRTSAQPPRSRAGSRARPRERLHPRSHRRRRPHRRPAHGPRRAARRRRSCRSAPRRRSRRSTRTSSRELGAEILLCNTYHLHFRPGADLIAELGGLHRFMAWDGPILTDSGGFQVFSLRHTILRQDDDGLTFRSVYDGDEARFTPELAARIQAQLGSDIAMCLDVVPPPDAPRQRARGGSPPDDALGEAPAAGRARPGPAPVRDRPGRLRPRAAPPQRRGDRRARLRRPRARRPRDRRAEGADAGDDRLGGGAAPAPSARATSWASATRWASSR